jgi:hypothetical protein
MRTKNLNLITALLFINICTILNGQYEQLNSELKQLLSLFNKLESSLGGRSFRPEITLPPVVEKVVKEKLSPQKIEEFRAVIEKEQLGHWFDNLTEKHVEGIVETFNKTTPGSLAGLVEIAQPQLVQELTPTKLGKLEQAVAQDPELVNILSKFTPEQISKFIEKYKLATGTIGNIARGLLPDIETKLSAAELKKIETVLTQRPDLIEVLAKLTETQLNQLIDAVKNNQNIDEVLEKIKGDQEKIEEEVGEAPPPPPPWEGGDVPPPPPPPGPAPIPQPKKIGLTAEELASLKPEQRASSDNFLQESISKLGFVHTKDVPGYKQTINNELKKIGASKGAGSFKFKDDNLPTGLEQAAKKFVDEKILLVGEKPEQTIERMKKLSQDQSIINEFIALFKPWILGDFNDFAKNVAPSVQGILINFGAAARKSLPLIDLGAIDSNSDQAQKSDEQFVMVFEQAPTYDMLIEKLNQIRLDLLYLKVDALEEDFVKKQRGKAGDAEGEEDAKRALERQIRERAGKQEGGQKQGGTSTIFDALEQSDTPANIMSKTDWNRYLFAVANFDQQAQNMLPTFITQIKEKKKKEPIRPDVPQLPFAKYADRMTMEAKSLKEFFDSIRAITKTESQVADGKVMVSLPEGLIKRGTYITFKPEDMKKFIAALPDLKKATLAIGAEQRLVSALISQLGILFSPGLAANSQEKLNKMASLSKGYSDIGQAFVSFFGKIANVQNLSTQEKNKKIVEWYQAIEELAKQKDFEQPLKAILSLLVSVDRTPLKIQTALEPFTNRLESDVKNRLFFAIRGIVSPYGSLSTIIRYYEKKMAVATTERERIQLLNELKEALQGLNLSDIVSDVALSQESPLGVNANESYKGNLTPLIKALDEGNVDHFVTLLRDSFLSAGLSVAQAEGINRDDAIQGFNSALDRTQKMLTSMMFPTIKAELENIQKGTAKIPGLIATDRNSQRNYRFAYEQYNKLIGSFLSYINKVNVALLNEKINNEIATNFDEFAKKWIDATEKAMREAIIGDTVIENVVKKINDFIVSIKDRFNYLVKK